MLHDIIVERLVHYHNIKPLQTRATNVQGGRGGLTMTKNTHFVRRFIENPTISDRCYEFYPFFHIK